MIVRKISAAFAAVILSWGVGLSAEAMAQTLTIYSGREEKLMGSLIQQAEKDLGIDIEVRYGDSSELAIALIEEGKNSRADVFYAQDAGALGAVAEEERTLTLPAHLLQKVDERFRSSTGQWIGISGRARVIDYNTGLVKPNELPTTVMQLTKKVEIRKSKFEIKMKEKNFSCGSQAHFKQRIVPRLAERGTKRPFFQAHGFSRG